MQLFIEHPPYVIAEVGACHNGEFERAIDLIDIAAVSGCRGVKFQLYNAVNLSARRHAPHARDIYQRFQLPLSWLPALKAQAKDAHMDLILSVYDHEDLQNALPYADWLKISSFESADTGLLDAASMCGRNLVVSAGMSVLEDMGRLWHFRANSPCRVAILHCVSAYPAPMHDLNLSVILHEDLDGFSDHSGNRLTGAVAVAHGAKILEVHIRDTHTPEDNPDYPHALGPSDLGAYVKAAVSAQVMGGHGRREIMPSEQANVRYRVQG